MYSEYDAQMTTLTFTKKKIKKMKKTFYEIVAVIIDLLFAVVV